MLTFNVLRAHNTHCPYFVQILRLYRKKIKKKNVLFPDFSCPCAVLQQFVMTIVILFDPPARWNSNQDTRVGYLKN